MKKTHNLVICRWYAGDTTVGIQDEAVNLRNYGEKRALTESTLDRLEKLANSRKYRASIGLYRSVTFIHVTPVT